MTRPLTEFETRIQNLVSKFAVNPPPLLYHYTSAGGLLGILERMKIWATGITYLNDSSEMTKLSAAFDNVCYEIERTRSTTNSASFFREARSWVKHLQGNTEVFVTSFSENHDLLSQWRGYCPKEGGYAIGFKGEILSRIANQNGGFLASCLYTGNEQYKPLREIVTEMTNLKEHIESVERSDSRSTAWPGGPFHNAITLLFDYIPQLLPLYKDNSFSEEKEWRVVFNKKNKNDGQILKFRAGNNIIIPYYEMGLEIQDQSALAEIVIGPTTHPELANRSLNQLLSNLGLNIGISVSKIPYRYL